MNTDTIQLGLTKEVLEYTCKVISLLEQLPTADHLDIYGEIKVTYGGEHIGSIVDRDGWWEFEPLRPGA